MKMSELVEPQVGDERPGFRLERLELWNWGTFQGGIQMLEPNGGWALIVGDNGSGKSTAIDALRTLLVPPRILNYNDASGDGRRVAARDRTRRSYVRGAWASSSVVDSSAVTTQYLREPGMLSGIAAVFTDGLRARSVTLSQILWEHDEQISEIYAIAPARRSLRELLEGRTNTSEIRRAARRSGWEIDDTFASYAERMRGLLHIPGEKALEVFNRAIGMKEVGDIDAFVRQFMLPSADTYAFVRETALPHYRTLLDCWSAIAKAERQIALLAPVRELAKRVTSAEARIADAREMQDLIAPFVASLHLGLLRGHIGELERANAAGESERGEVQTRVDELRRDRDDLIVAQGNSDAGARLAAIESALEHAEDQRKRSDARRVQLTTAVEALGARAAMADAATFVAARESWETRRQTAERDAFEQDQIRAARAQSRGLALEIAAEKQRQLDAVELHRVNIPYQYLDIRSRVARAVGVEPSVLPFAGELMEVREDYAGWTGAIERLLHGFALSLLVPDAQYRAAAKYINVTHLGIRLTFHRLPDRMAVAPTLARDRVPGRMRFRLDHALHLWVVGELVRSFNHRCCETTAELEHVDFGLTREGLVRNGTRHVKDDARRIDDLSARVLGWSVEEKIATLRQQIREQEDDAKEFEKQADGALRAAAGMRRIADAARDLLNIVDFADVNPAQWSARIIELNRERDDLSNNSEQLRTILARLKSVNTTIAALETDLRVRDRVIGGIRDQLKSQSEAAAAREEELRGAPSYEHSVTAPSFDDVLSDLPTPTVGNCDSMADKIRQKLQVRINSEQRRATEASNKMAVHMSDFLNEFAEYRQTLRAEVSYADGFVAALNRIEGEELPKHRERFEQYLSENLVGTLVMLQHRLDQHQEDIDERIREINEALRAIDYTDDTYVELRLVPKPSTDVAEFKRALKECFEHGITPSPEDHLLIFQRVRALLEGFEHEPERTQRVLDVRGWLSAGIRERRRNDDGEVNFYAATTGKSGGQKAKLAFTILASALCAQYGLTSAAPDAPEFRLVVIDEAFSRTDETNSTQAMQLFARLGFQLLIVGPFDAKAKLAVPFVDTIHLVANPGGNDSRLHTLARADVGCEALPATAPDDAFATATGPRAAKLTA